jgi:hypothetical protein
VPEGDQDHRRVPVALPIVLGRLDEALDLCRRQVLTGPKLSIRWTSGWAALRYCALLGSGLTSCTRGVMRKSFGSS